MAATAYIFPGQGSQYVGMARDLFESNSEARSLIQQADGILGISLSKICFEGPEDVLRQTQNTQPAIFLHSMAVMAAMKHPRPEMAAGHSLGEYSALVVAGALEFADALRLVRLRGELMQQAGQEQPGTMAAIVGLGIEATEAACREASAAGVVQPANFNSPGQIVISGSVAGVRAAMDLARQQGAKMVKELVVSGAFHSPLMESARTGLKAALDATSIRDAAIPVYANVTAEPVTRSQDIRSLLYQQLTSPVRWEQTVRNMVRDGVTNFIEIGPGKVLQGLVKRTAQHVTTSGIDKNNDIPIA
jgi:[acyl-carrier-protein] S-malonyltransferase